MKTLFIPTISKLKLDKSGINEILKKLPKEILICYSIQFKEFAKELSELLKKENNKVQSSPLAKELSEILSNKNKKIELKQVLGCSKLNVSKNIQVILLIGSGKFHAVSIKLQTKKPVYILENNNLIEISNKDIEEFEKLKKISYIKFLNSKKIGVLISTKPGQEKFSKTLEMKIKNKKLYFFIANELNTNEFENFPELKSWVNTACPRMDMADSRIINLD